ncbi:MAG: 50S ribosomal protein L25 [Planctomycetota bacterium]
MSSTLKAQPRERLGSRHCRRLRAEGRLPISIQGEGKANADLSIDLAEFLAARRHHESLFDIEVEGSGTETAMVRELQYDSLGEELVHAEFRRVVRGVETEAEVELVFLGNYRGGVMQPLHTTLRVKAIPSKLPDSIEIHKDRLEVEHFLLAKDLALPEGVSLACEPDFQVAVVAAAEGVDEAPAEGGDDDAEPEIIGRQSKSDD